MKDINPGTIFFLFIILTAFGMPAPLMIFAFVAFVIFKSATNNQNPNGNRPRNQRDNRRRERDYNRRNRQPEYQRPARRDYERAASRPTPKPKSNPFKNSGIEKYKDYDYEGAIEDFTKALQINPKDIAVHFNLACAYSLTEQKDKAFEHLDKATALGFSDFGKIKTHDALAYLRIQDEFEDFEKNRYRLGQKKPEGNSGNILESQNLLEQLKKLAELREQGLLTEEEFTLQKKRLLG